MLYDLGVKVDIELNAYIDSNSFIILGSEPEVTLTATQGGVFYRGNIRLGGTALVSPGDSLTLRLQARNIYFDSKYSVIRQDGEICGTFGLVTEVDPLDISFREDLKNKEFYEPYDYLDGSSFTPTQDASLYEIDLKTDNITEHVVDYAINFAATDVDKKNVNLLNDFQFNTIAVYVNDTFEGTISASSPAASASAYDTNLLRVVTFVGEGNGLKVYDKSFNVVATINSLPTSSPIRSISVRVLESGSYDVIYCVLDATGDLWGGRFEFDAALLQISNLLPISFTQEIKRTVFCQGEPYVLTDEGIWSLVDDTTEYSLLAKVTLNNPVTDAVAFDNYDEGIHNIYVAHGYKGKFSVVDMVNIEVVKPVRGTVLGHIDVDFNGDIYVTDVEENKVYWYSPSLFFNKAFDLNNTPMGISAYNGKVYVPSLYKDSPERYGAPDVDADDLTFDDVFGLELNRVFDTPVQTVSGITVPITLRVRPDVGFANIVVNGIEMSDNVIVKDGDEIQIRITTPAEFGYLTSIAVLLGNKQTSFLIATLESNPVPDKVRFEPQYLAEKSTIYSSNIITITGLEGTSIPVIVENGILRKNNVDVGAVTSVVDGDQIVVKQTSSHLDCTETIAFVSFGAFRSAYLVSTGAEVMEDIGTPNFFEITDRTFIQLGATEVTETITISGLLVPSLEVEIPEIYNAYISYNSVSVGRKATISNGGTFKIVMQTSYFYDTDHHIPISWCGGVHSWQVTTIPDTFPTALVFDPIYDVHPKDRQTSNTQTIRGMAQGYDIPISFPPGVLAFINGVEVTSENTSEFENVYTTRVTTNVKLGDEIYMEGYSGTPYGSASNFAIVLNGAYYIWNVQSPPLEIYDMSSVASPIFCMEANEFIEDHCSLTATTIDVDLGISYVSANSKSHNYIASEDVDTASARGQTATVLALFEERESYTRIEVDLGNVPERHDIGSFYFDGREPERHDIGSFYFDGREPERHDIGSFYFDGREPERHDIGSFYFDGPQFIKNINSIYVLDDVHPYRNSYGIIREIPYFNNEVYGITPTPSAPNELVRIDITRDSWKSEYHPASVYFTYEKNPAKTERPIYFDVEKFGNQPRMLDADQVRGLPSYLRSIKHAVDSVFYIRLPREERCIVNTPLLMEVPSFRCLDQSIIRFEYEDRESTSIYEKSEVPSTRIFERDLTRRYAKPERFFERDLQKGNNPGIVNIEPNTPVRNIAFKMLEFGAKEAERGVRSCNETDMAFVSSQGRREQFEGPRAEASQAQGYFFDLPTAYEVAVVKGHHFGLPTAYDVAQSKQWHTALPEDAIWLESAYHEFVGMVDRNEYRTSDSGLPCEREGFFTTEALALADADSQGKKAAAFAFEVHEGCWVWNTKTPCDNLCTPGCPPGGYIKGG